MEIRAEVAAAHRSCAGTEWVRSQIAYQTFITGRFR